MSLCSLITRRRYGSCAAAIRKLSWSPAAPGDLIATYDYLAAAGAPDSALRLVQRIEQRCSELLDFPLVGRQRESVRTGLRTLPFETFIIVYDVNSIAVRILRVFNARQNYERQLRRST